MFPLRFTFILALLVAVLTTTAFAKQRYDGHSVFRFNVKSLEELNRLSEFVRKYQLDVWTTVAISDMVDIRVPPEHQDEIRNLNIANSIFIPDVQQRIDTEEYLNTLAKTKNGGNNDFFQAYHTYEEIVQFCKDLERDFSHLVKVLVIGESLLGREIIAVVISSPGNSSSKPGFVLNGLQHAREWATGSTVTYIMNQLVRFYGEDADITTLLDNFEFTIVPILNPDGYIHSHKSDRMWRKNLRKITAGCTGIDLNRNWDDHFTPESPSRACQQTYNGPSPFSEPETKALANYIIQHGNVLAYIDVHAYSQLWMWSYGWGTQLPPDQAALKECAAEAVRDLVAVNGTVYKYGNMYSTIYPALSTALDWAYSKAGVKYSYTIEIRDTGRYGFLLPPVQILPTAIETFAGIKTMGKYIIRNG